MSAKSKHMAVILFTIEVHELLDSGECSGNMVSAEKLQSYGLNQYMKRKVTGFDEFDCLKKLKNHIDSFES
jgi:hypothetical protein